ncbi:Leucine-rich repeat and fibronectin type-III domain-containing protein 5 [Frankliniella fusca]|uniref:Leucine-rich repeat and fibronectin type-III domain-containing protein 5 n=1 Tax=Frankliniella fusca TaxID=407009 RepID=A0AAE1H7N6_9NEOP|nr:Leucine-rich repeat and fibronectin type-III domain-containing protein 5 [Frankliniella fusca]
MRWLAPLAAVVLAHCLSLSLACPSSCECKWKNGKQTALCVSKELRDVPQGLDAGTQVLDLTGNAIRALARERFQQLDLVNLQRIYLARNGLADIAARAFHGLTNLVELDLSHNNLTAVPSHAFKDFPHLMRLTLSGNPIRSVAARAFQPLSYLVNLELSGCAIETVLDDAFAGLEGLEWLKLDGNRLRGLQGANVLPKTLHGVDIHNNPWECDCGMVDLRRWIGAYRNPLAMEPVCRGPARLRGRAVRDLAEADLACLPEVSPTTLYLEISEGKNVTLQCKVNATPEAKVSWYFQGNVLQNDTVVAPGVRLLYYVEDGGTVEKKSNLFIYHANTDDNGTFVCQAENQAGRIHANYTIRVMVREEPQAEASAFPMEYLVAVAAGLVVAAALVCVSITACIISCRKRRRRRRKAESGKAVALHQSQTSQKEGAERLAVASAGVKMNGTVFISDRNDLAAYQDYPLEQNPDLINDAESVGKDRRLKGGEETGSYQEGSTIDDVPSSTVQPPLQSQPQPQQQQQQAQPVWPAYGSVAGPVDMYHTPLSADVHLSAGRFLDGDGYPLDYGLPKLPLPHPGMSVHQPMASPLGMSSPLAHPGAHPGAHPPPMPNMYRTLPHKPRALHAGVAVRRYSRDAEFLPRPSPTAYDPFLPPDVRYTVDGYPTSAAPVPVSPGATLYPAGGQQHPPVLEESLLPSPPQAYKSDAPPPSPSPFPSAASTSAGAGASCCVGQHCQQQQALPVPARCSVAAQTGEDASAAPSSAAPAASKQALALAGLPCTLTESPDEGYEGEGVDADM